MKLKDNNFGNFPAGDFDEIVEKIYVPRPKKKNKLVRFKSKKSKVY